MSCCVGFETTKAAIEAAFEAETTDWKAFIVSRDGDEGLNYKVRIGVVVTHDIDRNTRIWEALLKMQSNASYCIKPVSTQVNFKDDRLVDLFLIDIETEVKI